MDHIAQDDQRECILQRRSGKNKHKGNTDDHARYGVGHQGNGVYDPFEFSVQTAPCGSKSRSVSDQQTDQRSAYGYQDRVLIYAKQALVI